MTMSVTDRETPLEQFRGGVVKAATGIPGFDEITCGGIPAGRPSLVAANAGSGKTVFAMEFLVNGIRDSVGECEAGCARYD
jgi:RecA/RadA recombinase